MTALYHDGSPSDDDTDIGTLWQEALIRYYEECGTDLRAIPLSRLNIDHIKAEQDLQLQVFASYRHDGGKLDKLRSLIVTNSNIVVEVATHIANAASAAFPPSAVILTAFNYVMNASRAVSDDYDMIVSFFDVMNSFLERVSVLERRIPADRPLRRFLVNVFSAMMTLSAIARKCRLKGRLSRWAKALIDGSDPKLKGAFDALHMHLQRFESVAMLTTLKHTLESGRKLDSVGRDVKLIQAGVEQNLVLSQKGYVLGLESKGHAKDAASTSHEILTVVTRQEERGAEYTAGLRQVMKSLNKMSDKDGERDQIVDAGSRKSVAMRALETLLDYSRDDGADLEDLRSHYVDGTFRWFYTNDVYRGFEAGKVRLLWVSGPAGMGKSTLAYTAVRALQEEFRGDATTSVAHFFFREEGGRVSVLDMLCSCSLQIATVDAGYREEAVADAQLYEKVPRGNIVNPSLVNDTSMMWEILFQNKFTRKSGRRLFLVLDGVDEAVETDRKHIEAILEVISRSEVVNIQVFFTSDPISFTPGPEATKVQVVEMAKEDLLSDVRIIIIGRLKSLDRLRKLPQRTKKNIVARLSRNADTLRYVDHMLRRLNQVGIEMSVLRQLNNLPQSTTELYKTILDECQKARTEQEIATLKRFFAWLAYTTEPFFLSCASRLLRHIAPDTSISIEEEIENRCAGILGLSDVVIVNDDGESQDDNSSDTGSDLGAYELDDDDDDDLVGDEEKEEVGYAIIGFQKGLRSYFRAVGNPSGDRLRSSASSAHAMILETIQSILCTESAVRPHYRERVLQMYAAKNWVRHLQAIDPAELSEEETACVAESLCRILSNRGGSIRKMEPECYRSWNSTGLPCVLGATEEAIQDTLAYLRTWAARTANISPPLISAATAAWMHSFAQNTETIFIQLAEAHVANWFAGNGYTCFDDNDVPFLFAHCALYLGREHSAVQQNEQLNKYFAEHQSLSPASGGSLGEESLLVVSRAFPHIEMTARSYLAVAASLLHKFRVESSLKQLDMAIQHADTDAESMEIYMRIADIRLMVAEHSKAEIQEAEAHGSRVVSGLSEGDDDLKTEGCGGSDGEATAGESDQTPAYMYDYWGRGALGAITKAAEFASRLPESAMEDTKVRNVVRDVWMNKAKAELIHGDSNSANTIAYCRRVRQACRKGEIPWGEDILPQLAKEKNWRTFLEVVRVLSPDTKGGSRWYLEKYTHEIHSAAKATGEIEYVLEQYREAVPPGYDIQRNEISLLIKWARFCRDVVGTVEATPEAKALLKRAIDAKRSARFVAEASFRLSDILLEEFRRSTQPKEKVATYVEMRDLVGRVSESMGAEFDPSQSQTVIPLAHMARKMDAVEFQRGLERTFEGCVAALTDQAGWNDRLGMRVLARVLALVGLGREAQIAATCQIYVLDKEIHRRENGWMRNSDHDSAGGSENSEGDDTEEEVRDVPAECPFAPASSSVSENGEEKSEAGGEGVSGGFVVDGDLGYSYNDFTCEGCNDAILEWSTGPVYLCYYCAETHLCRKCFDERAERIAGKPSDDWQVLCPEGHKHIRIPVEGWKGLRDGVFRIGDTETPFREWLVEVKEKRWPEAWERFWTEEQ